MVGWRITFPRGVHQNVNPSQVLQHSITQRVDRLPIMYVCRMNQRPAAERFDLFARALDQLFAAAAWNDIRTVLR